jgi:hypothetical protein
LHFGSLGLSFDFWFPLSCDAATEAIGDVIRVTATEAIATNTNKVTIFPLLDISCLIVHNYEGVRFKDWERELHIRNLSHYSFTNFLNATSFLFLLVIDSIKLQSK